MKFQLQHFFIFIFWGGINKIGLYDMKYIKITTVQTAFYSYYFLSALTGRELGSNDVQVLDFLFLLVRIISLINVFFINGVIMSEALLIK